MEIFFCGLHGPNAKCEYRRSIYSTKAESEKVHLCYNKTPYRNQECYYKMPGILERSDKIPDGIDWEHVGRQ